MRAIGGVPAKAHGRRHTRAAVGRARPSLFGLAAHLLSNVVRAAPTRAKGGDVGRHVDAASASAPITCASASARACCSKPATSLGSRRQHGARARPPERRAAHARRHAAVKLQQALTRGRRRCARQRRARSRPHLARARDLVDLVAIATWKTTFSACACTTRRKRLRRIERRRRRRPFLLRFNGKTQRRARTRPN